MHWSWVALACAFDSGVHANSEQPVADPTAPDPLTHDADHDGTVDASDCAPYNANIRPGAAEACDGIDNDCDDKVDEGDYDLDDDGYDDQTLCQIGESTDPLDCDDDDASINPAADDGCDGIDNNCDGLTDNDDVDADGDDACTDCNDVDPFLSTAAPEVCDALDNNCDGSIDEGWDFDFDGYSECQGDCDDENAAQSPGTPEACNSVDDNCDGLVDESFDLDADGQSTCGGDCNDANAAVYALAPETCDGLVNDCTGSTDENADLDADGYSICTGDCDDANAAALPGATEVCDGVDNDCNGFRDELAECFDCVQSGDYSLCSTGIDWVTAEQACRGFGGALVLVGSGSENDDVANLATIPTWIGATDAATEDTWLWSDSSSVSYDHWLSGQPDNSGDCAITNSGGRRGYWADEACSTAYPFVCEF